jgi:glutamine amidotransferase
MTFINMPNPIAIVDYGMGNLRSVQNAVKHLGFDSVFVFDPTQLAKYEKIILPGVGAFSQAINFLHSTGMAESLNERKNAGVSILGICLGMQLMCKSSEEDGLFEGLGWFDAEVRRFPQTTSLPVPHMGWNGVNFQRENMIFKGIQSDGDAYFVHSYHVACNNSEDILATTEYGIQFASIIHKKNLIGIQFHPEKSQEFGLQMIRNFLESSC